MVLDICHTLNQFCAPLPLEYAEFKEMSNTVFPNILDTKVCLYLRTCDVAHENKRFFLYSYTP